MRSLVPQALSAGRGAFAQRSVSLSQRASFLPLTQTASASASASIKTQVGYKPNPLEKAANKKNKIPYSARPVKRPFVPLPTKTEAEVIAALPYIVRRTPYSQLPIYRKWMSGGNRCLVILKKVDGDRARLVEDLTTALEVKRPDIRLNPTTQHIEIKVGRYTPDLQAQVG